jgi:hypothetical protein
MSNRTTLEKALDRLIGEANEQTQLYNSAQEKLYITLGETYLWWRDASKIKGFLDDIYAKHSLVTRGNEENFTRLIRLIWQLGWDGYESGKVQSWARALRAVHHEYETNTQAYKVKDAALKISQFIRSQGGISQLGRSVDPLPDVDDENYSSKKGSVSKKKSDADKLAASQIRTKHIEQGEVYFSKNPPYLENLVSKNQRLKVNRKGYAVALVRRNEKGAYDLLGITNNELLVQDAIIETYKRNDKAVPHVLRALSEAVKTQALPKEFEKHRSTLTDPTDIVLADGKTKLRTGKRLRLRPKSKDIIFSEIRTDCSVVTIAKPHKYLSDISEDIILRTTNLKYLEKEIIQTGDLCFFTTLTPKLEEIKDAELKASHRLQTKNTVTGRIYNLYFYKQSSFMDRNKAQADLNREIADQVVWGATVDSEWVQELQSICVDNWLREYGVQINRDRNKQVKLSLSNAFEVSFDGTRGNYNHTERAIPKPKLYRNTQPIEFHLRSKDIFTVLNSLSQLEISGDIELTANEHVFCISFETSFASYIIAVPTCNAKGHLDKTAFVEYKA